jgi:hypothetical protein
MGVGREWLWAVGLMAALGCSSGDASSGDRSDSAAGPGTASGPLAAASAAGSGAFGAQPIPAAPQAGSRAPAGSAGPVAGSVAECAAISATAQGVPSPVDIVWIVDGSASMVDETLAVQENITQFAHAITTAGLDVHVVMLAGVDIAGPTSLGMDPARYLYVPALVGSNDALLQLLTLHSQYAPFLRPNAALHFVAVTDDESFLPAQDFKSEMETVAGKPFTFHAIASESADGLPCVGACGLPIVCGAFAPGAQYYALAEQTSGQQISICTADWSMVFGSLQDAVIASAPLPCSYPIPTPPSGESLDAEKVNLEFVPPNASAPEVFPRAAAQAQCGDNRAWFYDDPLAPTAIEMCPSACTAISAGGSVQIKLGCKTIPLTVM